MPLTIGFDAKRVLENATGLGSYGRTVVRSLRRTRPEIAVHLFAPRLASDNLAPDLIADPAVMTLLPSMAWQRPLWRPWLMCDAIARSKVDIFHGLSNELPIGIERIQCRSVVTIHDLIFRFFPDQYSLIDRTVYDYKSRRACKSANHIIAASESARRDIVECYNVDPSKISVVYQGCDASFYSRLPAAALEAVRIRYGLPKEYLFTLGTMIERKNLFGLVRAWSQLPSSCSIPLVVVGRQTQYSDSVKTWLRRQGLESSVHFLSGVPNTDLPALYQGARAFAFPSHYEGFGIPVLEALASGIPVVTSSVSSLPEAGGSGAVLVDPASQDEIAAALERVLADESVRERLAMEAPRHLERFTPERLISDLVQVYQNVMK
jgi:glycosyltransferase involved in cell wall biosynthesis